MPIEIRELIIKTEIKSEHDTYKKYRGQNYIKDIKRQVLEECKKLISESTAKKKYNR